jgi:hypothetical protein
MGTNPDVFYNHLSRHRFPHNCNIKRANQNCNQAQLSQGLRRQSPSTLSTFSGHLLIRQVLCRHNPQRSGPPSFGAVPNGGRRDEKRALASNLCFHGKPTIRDLTNRCFS